MDVEDKLVIALEVAEGNGFNGGEGNFPPDSEFVLEGHQLWKYGFDEVFTLYQVVYGVVGEQEYSHLALVGFVELLYPARVNNFLIRVKLAQKLRLLAEAQHIQGVAWQVRDSGLGTLLQRITRHIEW